MSNIKTFLFVSIDGMTDPLGQSQVLPYLVGLAKKGYTIGIVSCEKKENWKLHHRNIEALVKASNIWWDYSFYKKGKPLISQIQNYFSLKKKVINKVNQNPSNTVLHCRSYLAGLIGLHSKKVNKTGFIFDMRGFWADERVEGGIWNKTNPIDYFLFSFFKRKEKEMLLNADAIVSLTKKAKAIILNWNYGIEDSKISVIPCCVDLDHFSIKNIDTNLVSEINNKYPQLKNKFVLSYVGSLGTWYMADEMLALFKLLSDKTNALFLIITKDDKELIIEAAKKQMIPLDKLIIVAASRSEMPTYISLSSASIFFIKPTFSKSASSPTKMGEILSMGIPILTNAGIGDVDTIIEASRCGISISDFCQNSYEMAVDSLLKNSNFNVENSVKTAKQYFSLEDGIEKYIEVYNSFK